MKILTNSILTLQLHCLNYPLRNYINHQSIHLASIKISTQDSYNYIAMNSTFHYSPDNRNKEASPKRTQKRSLPIICRKEVPLHNNSQSRSYRQGVDKGLTMEQWAYVADPKRKKDIIMTKYAKFFKGFAHESDHNINPEISGMPPSMQLLDKYFKRKNLSKLKQTIKIPMQSVDEGVSSIGFEGINVMNSKNRRTIQGFYKAKKNATSALINTYGEEPNSQYPYRFRDHRMTNPQQDQHQTVDHYFMLNRKGGLLAEKRSE